MYRIRFRRRQLYVPRDITVLVELRPVLYVILATCVQLVVQSLRRLVLYVQ